MMYDIYERTDLADDGLILIQENKERKPLEKEIILVKEPWVGVMPYGPFAGEHAVWIQVSFSPLESFPYDDKQSRRDRPDAPHWPIQRIVDYVARKMPYVVYIIGGDPMFKWDAELKHLCYEIHKLSKKVVVETSGIIFPNVYEDFLIAQENGDEQRFDELLDTQAQQIADYHIIKPQLFGAVPDNETGGYFQYLPDMLERWKRFAIADRHWHFDINMDELDEEVMDQLIKITVFMRDLFEPQKNEFWGEAFVFTPMVDQHVTMIHDYIADYRALRNLVDQLLPNYKGASVHVQVNHAFLG